MNECPHCDSKDWHKAGFFDRKTDELIREAKICNNCDYEFDSKPPLDE